jgi:transposase
VEFRKFLVAIDKAVPADLDVHLICDNLATHKTPAIRDWLARHPRFHLHFTPTGSSWINQVVRHEVARVQRYSSKEGRLMSMV